MSELNGFFRAVVKLYSDEPQGLGGDAAAFVPIFHEWIRGNAIPEMMLFDVADYAHAPDSPGIMLVAHEVSFALDRSDGRFGLLAQRRTAFDGSPADAIATTLRQALKVAGMLERDERLHGKLKFGAANPRIEANDRLRVPNSDEGFRIFVPAVQEALASVYPGHETRLTRVENDPRDRLAVQAHVVTEQDVEPHLAA